MTEREKTPEENLGFLLDLIRDFHNDFCIVRPGVPTKPKSEYDICHGQIYSIGKGLGFSAEAIDTFMDDAEREHAQYTVA